MVRAGYFAHNMIALAFWFKNVQFYRYLLQLYHVYGGFFSRADSRGTKLPSQDSWYPWDASMGKLADLL